MSIPYTPWPDGALQGNIPVNDSLQAFSALGQAAVESTTNTPPTTALADVGRMWLVGTAPTGAWAGRANNLALCTAANVWRFFAPGTNAWIAWDKGTSQVKRYDTTAAAWVVWSDQVMRGFKNYLINGDLLLNQRAFTGGALAAGVYGFDRWKGGTGGCTVSVNTSTAVITLNGPLVQVVELPRLASAAVVFSVEDPSGTININVDGQTASITSGSGRRGATVTLPSGSTGNVTVTVSTSGSTTFKRMQLELGTTATPFEWRPAAVEFTLAARYYRRGRFAHDFNSTNGSYQTMRIPFGANMRAAPAVAGTFTYTLATANGLTDNPTVDSLRIGAQATATGNCAFVCDWTADAEL